MIKRVFKKFYVKAYFVAKNRYLNNEEFVKTIAEAIEHKKPILIGRLGTEVYALNPHLLNKKNRFKRFFYNWILDIGDLWNNEARNTLWNNTGFFPLDDSSIQKFSDIYAKSCAQMDFCGYWGFVQNEEFAILNTITSSTKIISPRSIEPYYHKNPWTKSLTGKTVLVIHPFTESIEIQYKKRTELFVDENILPLFDLITVKSVQSLAFNTDNYSSWFEALDFLKKEIDKVPHFDVAIIGAGSYGLPLGEYCKNKGAVSVVMGGAVQILFGIKGNRWDNHSFISQLYNSSWVRPLGKEQMNKSNSVENSCYW